MGGGCTKLPHKVLLVTQICSGLLDMCLFLSTVSQHSEQRACSDITLALPECIWHYTEQGKINKLSSPLVVLSILPLLGREIMSGQLRHNKVPTKESQPLCQGLPTLSCLFSTSWECWEQPLAILHSSVWLTALGWMGTLYRLRGWSGWLRGRAWGRGVKGRDCVLRLKPGLQIKPSCPSFAAAEAQQGWRRKPECLCHFTPAEGAGKCLVKRVHSGGVTLVQQEASLLCPDLHGPFLCRFDVQLHL